MLSHVKAITSVAAARDTTPTLVRSAAAPPPKLRSGAASPAHRPGTRRLQALNPGAFGVGVGGDTSTGGVEMVSTLPAVSKAGRWRPAMLVC